MNAFNLMEAFNALPEEEIERELSGEIRPEDELLREKPVRTGENRIPDKPCRRFDLPHIAVSAAAAVASLLLIAGFVSLIVMLRNQPEPADSGTASVVSETLVTAETTNVSSSASAGRTTGTTGTTAAESHSTTTESHSSAAETVQSSSESTQSSQRTEAGTQSTAATTQSSESSRSTQSSSDSAQTAESAVPAGVRGDADCSGQLTVADAILVKRMLEDDETVKLNEEGLQNADFDGNGVVNMNDVTEMLNQIIRMNPEHYSEKQIRCLEQMFGISLLP